MFNFKNRWNDIVVIALGVMLGLIFFSITAFLTAAVWVKYISWIESASY